MDEAAPDVSATEGGGKVIRDAQGKVLTKEALEEFRKKEKKKGVVRSLQQGLGRTIIRVLG